MTDNWNYYYKIHPASGNLCTTNMLYSPKVNPEGNIMCMVWDETCEYQKESERLTKDLIDFFFPREVKYLTAVNNYSWAPEIIDIDTSKRKIFIEWNKVTLNNIIYDGTTKLEDTCPDWKAQIFEILYDLVAAGYYKMALYPHCFFINKDSKIKTFDYYSCLEIDERYVSRERINGMIGADSVERFNSVTVNGMIDFKLFFKHTLEKQLASTWLDNPFPEFYERLTNEFPQLG